MAAQHSPTHALASHVLSQTLSAIALLESLDVINPQDAGVIRSKLPSPSGPFPSLEHASPRGDMSASFQTLSMGSSTPSVPALPARRVENRAKALWDYHGTAADDLAFRAGDIIIIDEEVNEQWFRGRVVPPGQSAPIERAGLFPSNYIEKIPSGMPTSPVNVGPGMSGQPHPPYYASPQQQPPPPGQGYQSPQQYPYEKPGYQQYPGPPQHSQQMMVSQPGGPPNTIIVQPEDHRKGRFGKIGSQLGNAAVSGLGFGAGSAIASEAVHASEHNFSGSYPPNMHSILIITPAEHRLRMLSVHRMHPWL